MRHDFVRGLCELAAEDPRIVLLTADLGFGTIEAFADRFPDRFINVGVAEQSLIGVATGLAQQGLTPYCYSIASFAVGRTWEFLRNGPVAHGLTVGLIGIGPGFDYGADGHTHHALEDISLIRSLDRSRVIAPADGPAAEQFGRTALSAGQLTYFRLARHAAECPVPRWHGETDDFARTVVISLGDAWPQGCEIEAALTSAEMENQHFVVEGLGSSESNLGLERLVGVERVIAVESHLPRGGLFSAVAEQLTRVGWPGRLLHIGPTEMPIGELGESRFLWKSQALPSERILEWVLTP